MWNSTLDRFMGRTLIYGKNGAARKYIKGEGTGRGIEFQRGQYREQGCVLDFIEIFGYGQGNGERFIKTNEGK